MSEEKSKKEEVAGVDLDQYNKDKDEFNDALDSILDADPDKSDEELMAEMDEKGIAKDTGEAGIAKKDLVKDTPKDSQAADPTLFGISPETTDKAGEKDDEATATNAEPDSTEIDWKAKAELAEAELAKEKQKTSSWNGRIRKANDRADAAEAKLAEALKAKPKADGDDSTESDVAVLERFGGDFPEIKNVIDIILKRVDGKADAEEKGTASSKPIEEMPDEETTSDTELQSAQAIIREAHPDLDEAVGSGVLLTWINQQADFIRPTLLTIYRSGKPAEVIKMVTEFKNKSGWKSQLVKNDSTANASKDDKLKSMIDTESEGGGPPASGPDKNDYDGAAKEAGL
jgi:hypothetical protein